MIFVQDYVEWVDYSEEEEAVGLEEGVHFAKKGEGLVASIEHVEAGD